MKILTAALIVFDVAIFWFVIQQIVAWIYFWK